jgi:hypothetical protein
MSGAIPPFPEYAFMAWCSIKAQGQLYLYLGRCLRHSFGMPSIPQALLNSRECITFYTSQGLTLSGGLLYMASSRAWALKPPPAIHGFRRIGHVV